MTRQTHQIKPARSEAQRAFHAAARSLNWDEATFASFESGRALTAEFRDRYAAVLLPATRAQQMVDSLVRLPS